MTSSTPDAETGAVRDADVVDGHETSSLVGVERPAEGAAREAVDEGLRAGSLGRAPGAGNGGVAGGG